jgi:type IV secretory pathway VirB2 component (pilin)
MSWLQFVQTASQFIVGPFGVSLIVLWVGIAGIRVGIEQRWPPLGYAIAGGVILFSSAWAVTTFMGA